MKNYKKTLRACYLGLITQAIAANFAPLLSYYKTRGYSSNYSSFLFYLEVISYH